jgi:Holliday junction resolvase-like predicted endonuclease
VLRVRPGSSEVCVLHLRQPVKHLGKWGEELAAEWFVWQGFQVVSRNWLTPYGELDVWVRKGPRNYLVEIKTRSRWADSLDTVGFNPPKLRRLAAIRSLAIHSAEVPGQFFCGFLGVVPRCFYWWPNVFDSSVNYLICQHPWDFSPSDSPILRKN